MSRALETGSLFYWGRLVLMALLGGPLAAEAHGNLAGYIQHVVHLQVDEKHVDITVYLTFFEELSARERAVMDANKDGRITRPEADAYRSKSAPEWHKQVKLLVAGREVTLIPLYDPEIELTSDQTAALAHHRLRLSFFAATPSGLKADDEILVEDHLWPGVKSLAAPKTEGAGGCQFMPETQSQKDREDGPSQAVRRFRFRCVTPPVANASSATSHGSPPSRSTPSKQ